MAIRLSSPKKYVIASHDGHVYYRCKDCGAITDDVYFLRPGTGHKWGYPLCSSCYERRWFHYWRDVSVDESDEDNDTVDEICLIVDEIMLEELGLE